MKKFQFRLEAVQRIRKSKEQEALRVLAEAQRALRAEIERRDSLIEAMNVSLERRERLGSVAITPAAFSLETDFITGTKVRVLHAGQAIQRAQRRLEKTMQEYLAAKRATKTIERLRERAVERHKRERAKFEQKQLDDLYTMRARVASESDDLADSATKTEEAAG